MIGIGYELTFQGKPEILIELLNAIRIQLETKLDVVTSPVFCIDDIQEKRDPGLDLSTWFYRNVLNRKMQKRINHQREMYQDELNDFVNRHDDILDRDAARYFFELIESGIDGNVAVGFLCLLDECCTLEIYLVSDDREMWHSSPSIKTQYAMDFKSSHVLACEIVKVLEKIGMASNIYDAFGYYNDDILDIEKWESVMMHVLQVAERLKKEGQDNIKIGGIWDYDDLSRKKRK